MHHSTHTHRPVTRGSVIHWARAYDLFFERISRASDAQIVALAGIRPGDSVLDVGCGPGSLTRAAGRAAEPGGAAHGLDPAHEMIARAQQNARRDGSAAQFQVGVIEQLPFPAHSFDIVLSRLMFHHLPGELKRQGLREIQRVLKPGGVCLTVDVDLRPGGLIRRALAHSSAAAMAHVNMEEYAQLYAAAGFVDIRTGPTGARLLAYVSGRAPAEPHT